MKKFTLLRKSLCLCAGLILLINCRLTLAQTEDPSIIWQKTVGGTKADEIRHLVNTPDGGCVFTGFSKSIDGDVSVNKGDDDLMVAKMDAFGNIEWLKTYGGNGQEWGRHIQLTADGGYIIAGHATSLGDFLDVQGNNGGFDYWIVKLDAKGEKQWTKALGGSLLDLGYSIKQTLDGGYIAFGGVKSSDGVVTGKSGNDADYWLVKLDSVGNVMWQHAIGGINHEEGSSVALTSDGGYIISGFSDSNSFDVTGNHGEDDAYIVKTDSLGNIEWARCYGGSAEDAARDALQTADGGYIFAGYTNSEDGDVSSKHDDQDSWVVKLDSAGNIQWEKAIGGGSLEYAYSIEENQDHTGYLVSGHSGSTGGNVTGNHGLYDIWVTELDLTGKIIWQKSLGGSDNDYGRSITQTVNGDFLVAGYVNSFDGDVTNKKGGSDGWIVRLKGDCFNQAYYQDADKDGFGNAQISTFTCTHPVGYVLNNLDCNDNDSTIFPNTTEVCNFLDDDCDTQIDEGVQTVYYRDLDEDSFGNPGAILMACSATPVGYTTNNADCDDGNSATKPTATESCNSFDDDCNGLIDEPMKVYNYTDNTSGIPNPVLHTTAGNLTRVNGALSIDICETGFTAKAFSTGNTFSNALPAVEFTIAPVLGYQLQASSFSADLRRNSNGPAKVRFAYSLNGGSSWIDQQTDHTFANNACGIGTTVTWDFPDFVTAAPVIFRIYGYSAASQAGVLQCLNVHFNGTVCLQFDDDHDGYIASEDCDDTNASIHPNAIEKCNGIDDNCNTETDEGAKTTFYVDTDQDTYGNPDSTSLACFAPLGFVDNGEDCNDNQAGIHPGIIEVCNGIDEDCDDLVDEGVQTVFYADTDEDSYGDLNNTLPACSLPVTYVENSNDCNDTNAAIKPSAPETCNGVDDNCNSYTDETVTIYQYTDHIGGLPENTASLSTGSSLKTANGALQAQGSSACLTGYSVKNFSTDTLFSNSLPAVEFTITPNDGRQINGASFTVNLRRNGAGPAKIRLAYSINGGMNWVNQELDHNLPNAVCGSTTPVAWDFPDFATGTPVTVRIYGYNASSILGILQVLNATFNGNSCLIMDADNDGFNTIFDCNDTPLTGSTVYPGAPESCNEIDDNCDGAIDEGVKLIFFADADADTYGNNEVILLACTAPAGYVSSNTDCNDTVQWIHPLASELCNAIDDDCDNQFDEGALATFYLDADNDTYGSLDHPVVTCPAPFGYVNNADDCMDTDVFINPGVVESCNLIDDNCNGAIDDGVQTPFYRDLDSDTFGNPDESVAACTVPPGYVANNADCDDTNPALQPNTTETCNGIDDNCNGAFDEAVQIYHYTDNTAGIPFAIAGNATGTSLKLVNGALGSSLCPTGFSAKGFADSASYSNTLAAIEFSVHANNGFELGASSVSADLRRSSSGPTQIRFAYSTDSGTTWIEEGINHTVVNGACGTTNTAIWDFDDFITIKTLLFRIYGFNAASTTGILQLLNINFNGTVCALADEDGDGFNTAIDCDDNSSAVFPGAAESCNGIDDNCNVEIDEGAKIIFYADADNDGYGNAAVTSLACNASAGHVADSTDCDDTNASIYPAQTEICNQTDENCNGQIDEGVQIVFYADADNDNFGTANVTSLACIAPQGFVSNSTDCNDANSAVNPVAAELCNGFDDNCNATTDEESTVYGYTTNISGLPALVDPGISAGGLSAVNGAIVNGACPSGLSLTNFTNANSYSTTLPAVQFTISPNSNQQIQATFFSVELRKSGGGPSFVRFAYSVDNGNNWISQDIDHSLVSSPCGTMTVFTWDIPDFFTTQPLLFRIVGFKASNTSGVLQVQHLTLSGRVCPSLQDADADGFDITTDCDDNNPATNPGATELCNLVDDNCNTITDEGVTTVFYADADNDTYGNPGLTQEGCEAPIGYVANNLDCNDSPVGSTINPAAAEICNALDDNCNTQIDEGVLFNFYADADNDQFGNPLISLAGCINPDGFVADNTDCNDSDNTIYPGSPEVCNGIDENCNSITDEPAPIYIYTDLATGFPSFVAANMIGTNFSFANGAQPATGCTTGFSAKNFTSSLVFSTTLPAVEFSLKSTGNYSIEATSISAELRRNGGGPAKLRLAYSVNGGNLWIDMGFNQTLLNAVCGSMTLASWDFPDFSTTQTILFRIYGFDASALSGSLQLLNVMVNGKVCELLVDNDLDGFNTSADCNDNNAAIYPGATEVCNETDDDCDAQIDEQVTHVFYADADLDTYGTASDSIAACILPSGYSLNNADCNDNNATINPVAMETCNLLDDNCNGTIDEGVQLTFFVDSDNDSYGSAASIINACTAPTGYTDNSTDCNDNNGTVHPDAAETCNNIDDNCNGSTDEPSAIYLYIDNTNGLPAAVDVNTTSSNLSRVNGATASSVCTTGYSSKNFPAVTSFNTNLPAIEFSITPLPGYQVNATSFEAGIRRNNSGPASYRLAYSTDGGNSWIDQGTNQSVSNSNCGITSEVTWDLTDFSSKQLLKFRIYGFNASATTGTVQLLNVKLIGTVCSANDNDLDGFEAGVDCNDENASIYPGAPEVCNTVDDDCDTEIDEGVQTVFYADTDGDQYGDPGNEILACQPAAGIVADHSDCDDTNANVNPAAIETCNLIDDNCNGALDEAINAYHYTNNVAGIPATVIANATVTNLTLVNGSTTATGSGACLNGFPTKNFSNITTYNPGLAAIQFTITPDNGYQVEAHSFSAQLRRNAAGPASVRFAYSKDGGINWIDQGVNQSFTNSSCDVMTNAGWDFNDFTTTQPLIVRIYGFNASSGSGILQLLNINLVGKICLVSDADGDGFAAGTDCDDLNPSVNPGATEICNTLDDDCDTQIDENVQSTFYADSDNDNFGNSNVTMLACSAPSGFVSNNQDCNDASNLINPSAAEVCNTLDDNCDTQIDEDVKTTFYADADNDSYGNVNVTVLACLAPTGFVSNSSDCNDAVNSVNPAALELCNTIDDDCDAQIDENVQSTFYADSDNDSYGNLSVTTLACTAPVGFVTNSADCNDINAAVNPGSAEVCNNIDDNCNAITDEAVKIYSYTSNTSGVPAVVSANATASNLLRVNNAVGATGGAACPTGLSSKNFPSTSVFSNTLPAIEFTITPAPSFKIEAHSITAELRRNNSGPAAIRLAYSIDGGTSWIDQGINKTLSNAACGTMSVASWDFIDFYSQQSVKFRIYGFNAAATTGVLQILNVNLNGRVCTVNDSDGDGFDVVLDCNDSNPLINPNALEICNTIDDNCDTQVDENVQSTFYADSDNDSYGNFSVTTLACSAPSGFVSNSSDCNDANNLINPTSVEMCNTVDDDCDTQIDENVKSTFYADSDNDNYGNFNVTTLACSTPSGFVSNSSDCNDGNNLINPAAIEICNTVDDDCDTQIDENVKSTFFADSDNDSYGNFSVTTLACTAPLGFVSNSTDCNDGNNLINPTAVEICNIIDDDCDTQIDENVKSTFYADADNDSYGNLSVTTLACIAPSGFVANSTDCNDNNVAVNPGSTELCNNIDDNCNAAVDEPVQVYRYTDNTSGQPFSVALNATAGNLSRVNGATLNTNCTNGFSSSNFPPATIFSIEMPAIEFTITPAQGYKVNAATISAEIRRSGSGPASIRFAYSRDNGATWIDQGVNKSVNSSSCGLMTPASWDFTDFSSQLPVKFRIYGFKASATTGVLQLLNIQLNGQVCLISDADGDGFDAAFDCNDSNPAINPSATEICNSIDDDCDAQTDENVKSTFYADSDNDSYGNLSVPTLACTAPSGFVVNSSDCNDNNNLINPAAIEICNTIDDDCDSQTDENVKSVFYADTDNDTYGNLNVTTLACTAPAGYVSNTADCNDANNLINPAAIEICNTIDDDCDTQVDENVQSVFFADADNDSYGNAGITTLSCSAPVGYVANNTDCNDANSSVNPAGTEVCNNIDDNCNSVTDEPVKIYSYTNNTSGIPAIISANATASDLIRVNSATAATGGAICPTGFTTKNFTATTIFSNTLPAVEFTVTPSSGFKMEAQSFAVELRRNNTGPATIRLAYSIDGGINWIDQGVNKSLSNSACGIMSSASWDFVDFYSQQPVKFRIYGFNASGTAGVLQVLNASLNGRVCNIADSDGDGFDVALDCNDSNPLVNPNAVEICNSIDDDCDSQTDENVQSTFFADADNDSYGNFSVTTLACSAPSGFVANSNDCNDADNLINPAGIEICNTIDDNCNTQVDENVQSIFYADSDNDSYGNFSVTTFACTAPSGFVANSNDCNDAENLINPAGIEICNTIDDNCNTQVDENVQSIFYADSDNDSYGNFSVTTFACTAPSGFVANSADCNDNNNLINPAAIEICNTIDDDCDSQTDENVKSVFYADTDNDTYGNLNVTTLACTAPAGYVSNTTDCNDANNLINPAALEICNSIDDDCDTQTDENVKSTFYADSDNDSYGNLSVPTLACTAPSGFVANSSDCNDNNNLINPAAIEICNTIDDDCDSQTDENVKSVFYADTDNDTYGNLNVTTLACTAPAGYVSNTADCNDANNLINPAAIEICNTIDDDCDTQVDENVQSVFFADADNDSYGNAGITTLSCSAPVGYVANNTDCNDANSSVNPAGTEVCNNIDDNCNSQADENVQSVFHADSDNDNYGDPDSTILACTAPVGFVANSNDCNDADNLINPASIEICNTIDDNCDFQVDENVQSVFHADSDNDSYGNPDSTILACTAPVGFVANSNDCNDADNLINPAGMEICNTTDDNCDSQIDENVQPVFYADSDNDNFGDPDSTTLACTAPVGFVSDNLDCDDSNNAVNPASTELCNSIDDNCNTQTDENVQSTFYADADLDGFGDSLSTVLACSLPEGYVTDLTDCNDNNSSSYPGAAETCNNMDDNCNLIIDEPIQIYTYLNDTSGIPVSYGLYTTASGLSRVNGANPTEGCLNGFSSKNFSNEMVFNANLSAIEFTITPDSAKSLTVNSFSVNLRRNGIGPASIRFAYSINGGNSWIDQGSDLTIANTDCGINTPVIWDFNDFTSSQPVIFRVYAFNASSNTGVLQLANLVVEGTVCASIDADADGYDQFIDCDEGNNLINPGADDICNGIDDNCNTLIDEGWQVYHFTDNTTGVPQSFANHADATSLTLVNGSIIAPGCPTGFSSKNYPDTTAFYIDLPAIEFTLAADSGYRIEASSFTANIRRNGLGPANLRFAYSIDSGANWIVEGGDHIIGNSDCGQTSITQWDFADFTTTQPVTFRIYGFNASSTGGVMQLLQVNLNGSVCLIPDQDNDGYNLLTDCNDYDETIHPNAGENCNGLDDDCDLVIDENSIPVTITPLGGLDLCGTDSVVLETIEGQGLIYQWNKNNQVIEGATQQTFTAYSPGSYDVFVIDSNNCSNTSSPSMVFNSCKTSFLLNTSKAKFQIYPNPTDGEFVFDFDAYFSSSQSTTITKGLIRVTNFLGQVIFEETVPLTNGRLQKEFRFEPSVAGGMYIFKFILTDDAFAAGEAAWSTPVILIK